VAEEVNTAKRKPGRPTLYSEELAALFCSRMTAPQATVEKVCAADDMPAASTIFLWIGQHPEFRAMYRAAQVTRTFAMAEEMLEIADTPEMGAKTTTKPDGKQEVTTGDMTEHRKLRVNSRQWLIARLNPVDFGDRSSMEIGPAAKADPDSVESAAKLAAILEAARRRQADAAPED
jgi:hypothetical protein